MCCLMQFLCSCYCSNSFSISFTKARTWQVISCISITVEVTVLVWQLDFIRGFRNMTLLQKEKELCALWINFCQQVFPWRSLGFSFQTGWFKYHNHRFPPLHPLVSGGYMNTPLVTRVVHIWFFLFIRTLDHVMCLCFLMAPLKVTQNCKFYCTLVERVTTFQMPPHLAFVL